MNFLSLWMVCARVTLIWGVLRGGKGSIRPKVRFENSAYGQGLSLGAEFVFKLEVGPGRKIPPRRLFGNDPLWAVRIGYCRDGYNLRSV